MDSQLDTQDEDVALTADQRGGYQVLSDAAALKQVSTGPGIYLSELLSGSQQIHAGSKSILLCNAGSDRREKCARAAAAQD